MRALLDSLTSWFKTKPRSSETYEQKVARVGRLAAEAIPAYASIIEASPLVIFPTSRLPLPKDEMKIALKLAWMTYTEAQQQTFVMQAYSHLAQFRDDVVTPIDPTLSTGSGSAPAKTLEILGPYLAFSHKVTAETEALLSEFETFTRSEAARQQ